MKGDLAKGALWLGAARVITNLLAFLSTLLLARLLSPGDFGLVALATTILVIVTAITDLSLANALIHHKDPQESHFHTAWTLNLARATLIGVAFCAAGPLAARIYNEPRLVEIMLVLGIGLALSGLTNPKTALLTRRLIFRQEFMLITSQKLAGLIVSATIAIVFRSYWALVAGAVAAQLVGIVVSYRVAPFRPKFALGHARELWSFSIWLTLGQIVNTLNWKFDYLLIGGYFGRPALGFYTVGDNLAVLPTREATAPLSQTLFPGLAKLVGEPARLRHAYQLAQAFVVAVVLPVGVGFALIAHPLVLATMGVKWLPAVAVIQVLASIFALGTLSSAVQPLAMAKGHTKQLFQRDLLIFAIRIPFIVAGMFFGGFLGIVYARAIVGVIGIVINMRLVTRLIGLGFLEQIAANARSLISVVVMAGGVLLLKDYFGRDGNTLALALESAESVAVGAALYVTVHAGLWIAAGRPSGPESEMIKLGLKLIARIKSRHLT